MHEEEYAAPRTFKDSLGPSVNVVLAEITQDFKRKTADAPEPRPELPGEATVGPATDGVCEKHARPLELFCSTDRVCVCARCAETDHGTHSTVPIEREWTLRCSQLKMEVLEVKQSILDRQRKVEEVKQRVELSRRDAEKELGEGLQVLAAVLRSVEKCQVELRGVIEGKQRTAEKRAEGLVGELEQEIGELKRRNAELKQLLRTQDRAHVLQSFPSQHTPLCSRHWPDVIVHTDLCVGTVRSVLSPLEEDFREKLRELTDAEFKKVQQYADDVTLDPITAHVNLTVSEDGKEVRYHKQKQNLPDNPERFDLAM
ncbi:hypothetical protein AAFF_G00161710 [Aldrovandia affinis]|uniref:B box-type domain-containing protein n=1 Tax=Aldrovandia affinis TaxID=143900 RepID=A0AAD7RMN9_9TELE|nr:hypothetical protein AAFF_G00161710 [Aldrovandia affinis]